MRVVLRGIKSRANRRKYLIDRNRIAQIINDVAEDMCAAKSHELIEVVKYCQWEMEAMSQQFQVLQSHYSQTMIAAGIAILRAKPEF